MRRVRRIDEARRPSPPLGPPHGRTVSLIVPFFNEAENLPRLLGAIGTFAAHARSTFGVAIDAVFVDDGSTDRGAAILQSLAASAPAPIKVRLIRLSRNFGKEVALTAGLRIASADAVVLMDADLQHPIELIDRFLEAWLTDGYDVVYAFHRRHEAWPKRLLRRTYQRIISFSADVEIPAGASDFRLLSRRAYRALAELGERARLMKGLYSWIGFPQKGIPYVPHPREAGRSKFSALQLAWLAWEGITSFSVLPLRGAIWLGFVMAAASAAYGIATIIEKLAYGIEPAGYATLITAIVFIGAAQLIFLGILGEYVGKVLLEVKGRPLYVVESDVSLGAFAQDDIARSFQQAD